MENKNPAAGVLLICDKKFLLAKRSHKCNYPHKWAIIGGAMDVGETSLTTIKRELKEETQINSGDIKFVFFERQLELDRPFDFYLGFCDKEYSCILDHENDDWGWFTIDNLPTPLFPTLNKTLNKIFKK